MRVCVCTYIHTNVITLNLQYTKKYCTPQLRSLLIQLQLSGAYSSSLSFFKASSNTLLFYSSLEGLSGILLLLLPVLIQGFVGFSFIAYLQQTIFWFHHSYHIAKWGVIVEDSRCCKVLSRTFCLRRWERINVISEGIVGLIGRDMISGEFFYDR